MTYSTGGPNNAAYKVNENNESVRIDPSESDTSSFTYSQQAAIISDEAYHGGGDVMVYAMGNSLFPIQETMHLKTALQSRNSNSTYNKLKPSSPKFEIEKDKFPNTFDSVYS